jgi:hypothetical protein
VVSVSRRQFLPSLTSLIVAAKAGSLGLQFVLACDQPGMPRGQVGRNHGPIAMLGDGLRIGLQGAPNTVWSSSSDPLRVGEG